MCNRDCGCLLAAVISAFVGIIIGVLFYFDFIPAITTTVWIAFGIAIFALIALISIAAFGNQKVARCICRYGNCLLTGIIGTIIMAIATLAITLTTGNTLTAILIALGGFFTALLIIALICLVDCLIDANCRCRE